jgi:hypothetical protein
MNRSTGLSREKIRFIFAHMKHRLARDETKPEVTGRRMTNVRTDARTNVLQSHYN